MFINQSIILIHFRTWNNYSIVTFGKDYEYWGACRPECRGEMPSAESEYNLAKDTETFNSVWTHGLYDLRQYEAGFCFTYDPPKKSASGVSNGLYFLLGHDHLSIDYKNISKHSARDSSFLLYSFDIYLHEKVLKYFRYIHQYFTSILHLFQFFRVNFGPNQKWIILASMVPFLSCQIEKSQESSQ